MYQRRLAPSGKPHAFSDHIPHRLFVTDGTHLWFIESASFRASVLEKGPIRKPVPLLGSRIVGILRTFSPATKATVLPTFLAVKSTHCFELDGVRPMLSTIWPSVKVTLAFVKSRNVSSG